MSNKAAQDLAKKHETSVQYIRLVEAYCGANGIPADYGNLKLLLKANSMLYFHLPQSSTCTVEDIGRAYIIKRGLPKEVAEDLGASIDFEDIGWVACERYNVWGNFVFFK